MADDADKITLADLEAELARITSTDDDFERLGADKLADRWAVRRIFVATSRRYHPDLHSKKPKEFQVLTEEIFMLLSEAERRLRRSALPSVRRRRGPGTSHRNTAARPASRAPTLAKSNISGGLGTKSKDAAQVPASKPRSKLVAVAGAAPIIRGPSRTVMKQKPSEGFETSHTPQRPVSSPVTAGTPESRYEAALHAMLAARYKEAMEIFVELMLLRPDEIRYQTASELARGHLAREAGRGQEALECFHRVCVLDGSCADAIQAIQALTTQGTDGEEYLLNRLLGDGR
jgi:hypothetical protein